MQQLAIGVVAHAARVSQAKALARQVQAQFISIDNSLLGCDDNHLMVLRHLSALGGEFVAVLEDDAVPVDGFRAQLAAAVASAPPEVDVLGLYVGQQRPPQFQSRIAVATRQADLEGAHWLLSRHLMHAVGYVVRTSVIAGLLDFDLSLPIDERISTYLHGPGPVAHRRIALCWPSLVDHADGPTLFDHPDGRPRRPGRTAWRTGTRDAWSSASVVLT